MAKHGAPGVTASGASACPAGPGPIALRPHSRLAPRPVPHPQLVHHGPRRALDHPAFVQPRAQLLDRAARAQVVLADHEDHAVHEAEGVVDHEPLHLAVGLAPPAIATEERPADLDLAAGGIVAVIARAA